MITMKYSNRNLIKEIIVLMGIFIINAHSVDAQWNQHFASWEVICSGGVSKFLNSVNPASDALYRKFNYWKSDMNPSVSVSVNKMLNHLFSGEIAWTTTRLSGKWDQSDKYGIPVEIANSGKAYPDPFKTGINEFDLIGYFYFNDQLLKSTKKRRWNIYFKGGYGITLLKAYSAVTPYGNGQLFKNAIILGGGFSFQLNDRVSIRVDYTERKVNSDRLDGLHTFHNFTPYEPYFGVQEKFLVCNFGIVYGFSRLKQVHAIAEGKSHLPWFHSRSGKFRRH